MAENIHINRTPDILSYLSEKLMKIGRDVVEYRTENSVGQLEQIVQILLELEQLDVSYRYEEAMTLIMRAAKLLQDAEENKGTDIVTPPLIYRSHRGRPSYNIPRETLVYFIENGFTTNEMANLMQVSTRTIANRLEEYDLSIRESYSKMNDAELDQIVSKLVQEFPDSGYKTILGHLKADGFRIQEKRIQQSMKRVDTFGVMVRKLFMQNFRIQRRQYNVKAPMSLWHVDSNHKLIRWRFVIHAGIDGYSRLPTYILVASDNTKATALMAFKTGVSEYGLPERVRTDKGKENIAIAEYMLHQRGINSNCHITGRSVHNQRIERFWREIWHGCTGAYYHLFCTMEEELILNVDNELDLLALHMVFLERMKQSLKRFCTAVAHRPLRTEGNKTPLQLWILGQGLNPREELSQEEAAVHGIDFEGPVDLNPEEDIVVPPLSTVPEHILMGVENIINRTVDNVFEVDTYISVKNYLNSQN